MTHIEIYTKSWCPFCARAKKYLDRKGLRYQEIDVTTDTVREQEMIQRSGRHTVPQIFIDSYPLGGSDALLAPESKDLLDRLLSTQSQGEAA